MLYYANDSLNPQLKISFEWCLFEVEDCDRDSVWLFIAVFFSMILQCREASGSFEYELD